MLCIRRVVQQLPKEHRWVGIGPLSSRGVVRTTSFQWRLRYRENHVALWSHEKKPRYAAPPVAAMYGVPCLCTAEVIHVFRQHAPLVPHPRPAHLDVSVVWCGLVVQESLFPSKPTMGIGVSLRPWIEVIALWIKVVVVARCQIEQRVEPLPIRACDVTVGARRVVSKMVQCLFDGGLYAFSRMMATAGLPVKVANRRGQSPCAPIEDDDAPIANLAVPTRLADVAQCVRRGNPALPNRLRLRDEHREPRFARSERIPDPGKPVFLAGDRAALLHNPPTMRRASFCAFIQGRSSWTYSPSCDPRLGSKYRRFGLFSLRTSATAFDNWRRALCGSLHASLHQSSASRAGS